MARVAESFDNDALVSFSRTNIPHQPVRGLDGTNRVSVKLGLALDNEGHLRAHAEGQTPLDSKARRTSRVSQQVFLHEQLCGVRLRKQTLGGGTVGKADVRCGLRGIASCSRCPLNRRDSLNASVVGMWKARYIHEHEVAMLLCRLPCHKC